MVARFLVVVLIVLIAGCSAGGNYKVTGPSAPLASSYDTVKLQFKTTANNSGDIIPDMRGAILGQLISGGRFKRVAADSDPADLVIELNITDYRRVSTAERFFIGTMAGPNRLTVVVSVTDGKSGAVLRQFQATGESAAHPLSGEAGYSDALREISKQVMLALS